MQRIIILVFLAPIFISCGAQNINDVLAKHQYQINHSQGVFSGEGFKRIFESGKKASVFLIGEDHGLSETTEFALALYEKLSEEKYNQYIGEIGFISAGILQDELAKNRIEKWMLEFPWTVPFVHWKGELELFQRIAWNGGNVWGIDQEFIFSPLLHLDILKNRAASDEAKSHINQLIKKEKAGTIDFFTKGNYLNIFMVSSLESDFEILYSLFKSDKTAIRTIEELHKSFRVYQATMNGKSKEANALRVDIMKQNFDSIMTKKDSSDKVLLKLGALHCFKKNSPTGIKEIGELINDSKLDSYHLLVIGATGTVNNYLPQNGLKESQKSVEYNIRKRMPISVAPFLANLPDDNDQWQFFDLIGARNDNLIHDEAILKVANGFDGLLLIPKVTAAKSLYD